MTLQKLAELTDTTLEGNPHHLIQGVADLEKAGLSDASFLANSKYEKSAEKTEAGVLFVSPDYQRNRAKNYLVSDSPTLAFQKLLDYLFEDNETITGFTGIHPTAVIHPNAKIGKNATVGPLSVIDEGAEIGEGTVISSGCHIGLGVTIGIDCLVHPHVVIRERCKIGNRVILQPGAVIGSCGFGYTQNEKGNHQKLSQVGDVKIDDDVEIGANSAVDRARFQTTKIGQGTKIDNLVQIAHGVVIGKHAVIAGQTGIAGSTELGDHVMTGGQVAIDGHLKIEGGTMIAARSGISKSLSSGIYSGAPAQPIKIYNRQVALFRKLGALFERVKKLESVVQR